jgi:hypothetical protein
MWILVNMGEKQPTVHSVHTRKAEAESWARCLSCDGEEWRVVEILTPEMEDIYSLLEAHFNANR